MCGHIFWIDFESKLILFFSFFHATQIFKKKSVIYECSCIFRIDFESKLILFFSFL